jgi:hypothetical protein
VPKAVELCGIPRSTGYVLLNEFNAGDGTVLPDNTPKERKTRPEKLFPEHSAFLIKLFDDNPSIVLEQVREELCNNFEGLTIALSSLYSYITEKCAISLKQATKYTMERDAPRMIELRFNIVSEWRAAGVDFQRNCVFVDEAGFHSQIVRNRAW